MSKFTTTELITAFSKLGRQLSNPDEPLLKLINTEHIYNAWFTPENVEQAIKTIGKMLNEADLATWLNKYDLSKNPSPKKIGLILAGNIPLVGFHDVLCVLATGNHALIKASVQDARLIKQVLEMLTTIDTRFANQFSFVERLIDFDAVIATGSNNSSRYFEYYFGKVPNIIRKNRNSLAVITGNETKEQLYNLGHDIFDYFGLGCRNISKILIPKNYNLATFFEAIEPYKDIINHNKYNNNYGYNRSIFLVGSEKHLDNNFLILKEDDSMVSPLAVLYYSYYDDLNAAEQLITTENENLQCVVSTVPLNVKSQVVDFGQSHQPRLWDYADRIDTMDFLANLHTFEVVR
ncbi:acyl-CoA reductase [Mucilaginibacter sp. UR6-11]|uniref:acyl-CoA reductase n=1 Tax=Mucilaginibacter sp. UR6-11 TaxID=1435644 RepID=UPI001E2E938F|nr:acyl-CoA reductase [Mucilaginibacter sp. UR6-11]MCC8427032.1 acyl-CoA reductase [Mucilaginibacter sp. UR6-11]